MRKLYKTVRKDKCLRIQLSAKSRTEDKEGYKNGDKMAQKKYHPNFKGQETKYVKVKI